MTDFPPQPGQSPFGQQPPLGQQPPSAGMPTAPPPPGGAPFASQPPAPAQKPGLSTGKTAGIVIGAVVGVFAVAGLIFGLTRNDAADDALVVTTSPDVTTVADSAVPATEPAVTDPPSDAAADTPAESTPDTVPADPAPDSTDAGGDASTTDDTAPDVTLEPPTTEVVQLAELGQLIAWTSFSEEPLDEAAEQVEIDQLLVTRTVEATAHPTAVSTLCAGIPIDAPIDLSVVWQFDGSTVKTDSFSASPPGAGTCISNEGSPLAAGAYQVFAANDDETEVGFVTTFVIGATEVNQSFVNNTDFDICDIGVAPLSTAFYEFFTSTGGPIRPGGFINIDMASVQQDLRVSTCDGVDLENLTFSPSASTDQPMSR